MIKFNEEVGKKLKKARNDIGLTMKEVGKLIDLHESTVQRYESGDIKKLDIDKMMEFAKILKISPVYLMGWDEDDEYSNSINIPVYGSIPAGIPLEAVSDIQGYVDIPTNWLRGNREYIALKVKGDSMYPKYLEGDTVIIQLQKDCENGQDCACYVNGYDTTLKKVEKFLNDITLIPINPNYPPKTYTNGEVSILGIVKELRRKV